MISRMETRAVSKVARRRSLLTPTSLSWPKCGYFFRSQRTFLSKTSARRGSATEGQSCFVDAAIKQMNSPKFGILDFTLPSSATMKFSMRFSSSACTAGSSRQMESKRWWKPMYPLSALCDAQVSPFMRRTTWEFISLGRTSNTTAASKLGLGGVAAFSGTFSSSVPARKASNLAFAASDFLARDCSHSSKLRAGTLDAVGSKRPGFRPKDRVCSATFPVPSTWRTLLKQGVARWK
mmetsp:Transcript_17333/g.35706  ORF Transcript_17333/g.35706 Transcript_17333/m.35706 type:complete len:236 (+) Transcript_17333:464-1171(+)